MEDCRARDERQGSHRAASCLEANVMALTPDFFIWSDSKRCCSSATQLSRGVVPRFIAKLRIGSSHPADLKKTPVFKLLGSRGVSVV